MQSITLKSPAKLNLYLKVLNRRQDGYHNLITLFEKIDLCDTLTLSLRPKGIKIKCSEPSLPTDSSNLAHKAARLLQKSCGVQKGVEIYINKKIPIAAGLGGGSSNAASALLGLNRLWGLGLSRPQLRRLGSEIGADVCFFLSGHKFAIGQGVGENLTGLRLPNSLWHIMLCPEKGLSTKKVYAGLNIRKTEPKIDLTQPVNDVTILTRAVSTNNISVLNKYLYNDLEAPAVRSLEAIAGLKSILGRFGVKGVLMSGSGPTVFGITKTRQEAIRLKRRIADKGIGCRVFVVRTF